MSLVGSLEDLSVGDILQIVSLSRKSGLLLLRSDDGEGRIVFRDGLVRAAFVKGEAEDLRALLLSGGFLEAAEFDRAAAAAAAHGDPVADVLAALPNFSKERLDSLSREQVERSVFRMFDWKVGEFSFEISDEIEDRDRELLLSVGINAQYLMMEATRLSDENETGGGEDETGGDDDIEFGWIDDRPSAENADTAEFALPAEASVETPTIGAARAEPDDGAAAVTEAADVLALAVARHVDASAEPAEVVLEQPVAECLATEVAAESATAADETVRTAEFVAQPAAPKRAGHHSLVLIDPDLAALEWQKSVLAPICRRIHIFQRADSGITRVRQYLRRGESPIALVSEDLPADPMSGIMGPLGLISRLRAHAPNMPIFLVHAGSDPIPRHCGEADGLLRRPANHQLANRRGWARIESEGEAMRRELRSGVGGRPSERLAARQPAKSSDAGSAAAAAVPAAALQRSREMIDRLRDPSVRGEVLGLVLEFAAEFFSRVAIFMVRDDEAVGMAQSGLERVGGPSDEEFRAISLSVREPSWFRGVLDRRAGVLAPPADAGDHELAARIGSAVAPEAYVAPIESDDQIVALVYGDNLPDCAPIGETVSLEIVLHEAGLAFERALLERAPAGATNPEGS